MAQNLSTSRAGLVQTEQADAQDVIDAVLPIEELLNGDQQFDQQRFRSANRTIASGEIDADGYSYLVVDTEGAAAADDLTAINGVQDGDEVYLRAANAGRVVTLVHNPPDVVLWGEQDIELSATRVLKLFGTPTGLSDVSAGAPALEPSYQLLSGSTDGRRILIAATATPGTLIHTAHATSIDRLWLYIHNSSTSLVKITIELGGTSSPNDLIEFTVPIEAGNALLIPGLPVTGGVAVRAFAGTTNVLTVGGFVLRDDPGVILLSGSTNGRPILVTGTSSGAAVTVHTAHATQRDRVHLWATNTQAAAVKLTVQFGGTTSPNDEIEITIPGESGLALVVDGEMLTNSLVVRAFAATGSVINLCGWVERVS